MYFNISYRLISGEDIGINPIYDKGQPKQMIALGGADWGKDSVNPLSKYHTGDIFIINKVGGGAFRYRLTHVKTSKQVLISSSDSFSSSVLYDFFEWEKFQNLKSQDLKIRDNNLIDRLKNERNLLRNILTDQGIRVITTEQAKQIGLNIAASN